MKACTEKCEGATVEGKASHSTKGEEKSYATKTDLSLMGKMGILKIRLSAAPGDVYRGVIG